MAHHQPAATTRQGEPEQQADTMSLLIDRNRVLELLHLTAIYCFAEQ